MTLFRRHGSPASSWPDPGYLKKEHPLGPFDEKEGEEASSRRLCSAGSQLATCHPSSASGRDRFDNTTERVGEESNGWTRPELSDSQDVRVVGMLDSRSPVVLRDFEVSVAVHQPTEVG